jgi:hypothetical protein
MPEYKDTVGQTRQMIEDSAGTQPGDPAKAATAILTALAAQSTPLRLPLGDDAVDAILTHLDRTTTDLRTWEKLARDTKIAD